MLSEAKNQLLVFNKLVKLMKKKICFIVTSRAQYARNKLLLEQINNDPDLNLQIIVGGSALLRKYGEIISDLKNEGFENVEEIYTSLDGGNNVAMAKTTGLATLEFTNILQRLNPDIVVAIGDRYEILAVAIAAAYLNIVICHIEGGDVSGTIDESVRHAVTKLSHLHFATNDASKSRLLKMGENPKHVYNVGSLDIEFLDHVENVPNLQKIVNKSGVGAKINLSQPFITVIQHPVTTGEDNFKNINETLKAVYELGLQAVWFWPNADAGEADMSHAIRKYREKYFNSKIHFITHLAPKEFINLLRRTKCLVGNSSAGVKECSYLGIPAVNIGQRQHNRLAAENLLNVGYDAAAIKAAIKKQIKHGPFPKSRIYFKAGTSRRIADIIKKIKPSAQKTFFE